ncbi:MAG TPA: DUF6491 family protein [Luteimonas sp.]|nr:DUF6491 family protein [Luteimonas sp.]
MSRLLCLALVASFSLAACTSSGGMHDPERLALYRSHAGLPVRDIRYYNPISWEKIDGRHLLLTMRPSEVWLIRLSGPCLEWGGGAPAITISSRLGRVSSSFDTVSTVDPPISCRIEEIRPLDIAAVRDSQRQAAG